MVKTHQLNICNKTRRLIGMFYRKFNFYMYSSRETSLKLYKSLFCPHIWNMRQLHVWDPYLRKDIKQIEDFALKACTKNWGTSYNFLLSNCNLNTMADRRNTSRLCKIVTGDMSYRIAGYRGVYISRTANSILVREELALPGLTVLNTHIFPGH